MLPCRSTRHDPTCPIGSLMQTCLWLARTMPFPLTSGDRIYTGKLVQSLASEGVLVTYVGFAGAADTAPSPNVVWHVVPGGPRGRLVSLLSRLPLVGAQHATSAYRRSVDQLLKRQAWDIIVIDQYGMGWVLEHLRSRPGRSAVMVFIGHDHEEEVTRQQWQSAGWATPKGLYHMQNHLKTRRLERRAARACHVITAITDADAACFRQVSPRAALVTLTPGYDGARLGQRHVTAATPRAVVMFGSYRWSAKQANLRLFLDHAHSRLRQAGIELRVVGDMDDEQRRWLEARYPSVRFAGFVKDPAPYLDARLAVVAEPIGGGFKLKLLDYIFNRVPIVTLDTCAAGLPAEVRRHVITVPDLDRLVDAVVAVIDDVPTLDDMQHQALAVADRAFDWADRGRALRSAILSARAATG